MRAIGPTLPPGVRLELVYDQAALVRDAVASVRDAMLIGALLASRVAMTSMPELVAILHSFVGAAAVLVGIATYLQPSGEIDAVYMFVNEFESAMSPTLSETRLLPIEVPKSQEQVDYIYEQKPEELLGTLLPRYIKLQVYSALLESVAAEHAARMTAMDAASSNASDVIDKLTLYMNRVRQASITREIIEIVSGAAALD